MVMFSEGNPPKQKQRDGKEGGPSPEGSGGKHKTGTILSEDYAEIVDEEGDYSTPASKQAWIKRGNLDDTFKQLICDFIVKFCGKQPIILLKTVN